MKPFLILLCFLFSFQTQAGGFSCRSVVQYAKQKILPWSQFKDVVQKAIHLEAERRFILEKKLNPNGLWASEIGTSLLVNSISVHLLGIPIHIPNLIRLRVSKLSDEELFRLATKKDPLSFKEISFVLNPLLSAGYLAAHTLRASVIVFSLFHLVGHPEKIRQAIDSGVTIYYLAKVPFLEKQDYESARKRNFSEAQIRENAFEQWKEAFRLQMGREADPLKFPEDREEWELQKRLSSEAPLQEISE